MDKEQMKNLPRGCSVLCTVTITSPPLKFKEMGIFLELKNDFAMVQFTKPIPDDLTSGNTENCGFFYSQELEIGSMNPKDFLNI